MCKQLSPIIPHNYKVNKKIIPLIIFAVFLCTKDSCLPVASFLWYIENLNDEPVEVSLMFTWQAGSGIFFINSIIIEKLLLIL
jgi:uncharacterized protein (DUF608 family)